MLWFLSLHTGPAGGHWRSLCGDTCMRSVPRPHRAPHEGEPRPRAPPRARAGATGCSSASSSTTTCARTAAQRTRSRRCAPHPRAHLRAPALQAPRARRHAPPRRRSMFRQARSHSAPTQPVCRRARGHRARRASRQGRWLSPAARPCTTAPTPFCLFRILSISPSSKVSKSVRRADLAMAVSATLFTPSTHLRQS